jgi:endo-1,4-beta-mannosidase
LKNRKFLISLGISIVLFVLGCRPQEKSFIQTRNGQIYIGDKKTNLIGANIPFWNRRWEKVTREDLKQDIEKIKEIGNTVRIGITYGEKEKGYFGTTEVRKDLLDKLDYFVKEAQEKGIVVIVTDGALQYFELELNKQYIKQILERLKSYKNVVYDIQNEPDLEAQYIPHRRATIVNWCNQMAEFIKRNDPGHHLVTIGFSGLDLILSGEINLDNIDIASFHLGESSVYLLKSRVETLRRFLKKHGYAEMPIAIEEVALCSKHLDEKTRTEKFQEFYNLAKELDVAMFLWWCLRDVPMDPNAVDGDRIRIEPHTCGIFNADFSRKEHSSQVAIEIGREATKLNFE